MASTITTLLITVFAATVANAGFSAWSDTNFPSWSSPFNLQPPPFPTLLGMNLPFPFSNFSGSGVQLPIKIPTMQDMMSQQAKPGSSFNSVAVVSQSHGSRGPDGQVENDGQATVMFNNNGHVTVEKHQMNGGGPTVIFAQSSNKGPSFSDYKTPEFKSPHFKMPKFQPITMKPFHMKPFTMKPFTMKPFTMKPFTMKPFVFEPIPTIDPATIRDYVPEKGEKFTGSSYRVQTYSSDVNGVKKSGGSSSLVLNDNGFVEAEDRAFSDDDPQ